MQIKITEQEAQLLLNNRVQNKTSNRHRYLSEKKRIMADIRRRLGLGGRRFTVFVENPHNPLYCVVRDKYTKEPLDDGIAPPVVNTTAPADNAPADGQQPASLVTTTKAPAKKAAAKAPAKAAAKPAAKKAPAKKAKAA